MVKNTLKTTVLLAGLGGLFVAVGGLLGGSGGAAIGLLIGLALVGGSYWFSDKLALKAARAQIVTEQQAPDLHRMVASLAQRADLPMPVVAISPALQPNAFATGLMQMAVSRSREFDADRGGAKLLGTGEPLARALEHIETAAKQSPPMEVAPAQAYAWIHNPLTELKGSRNPQSARMASLFSTHPPTAERIRRLHEMSHQH